MKLLKTMKKKKKAEKKAKRFFRILLFCCAFCAGAAFMVWFLNNHGNVASAMMKKLRIKKAHRCFCCAGK